MTDEGTVLLLVAQQWTRERLDGAFVLLCVCQRWRAMFTVDLAHIKRLALFDAVLRRFHARHDFISAVTSAHIDTHCRAALLRLLWTPSGRWTDSCVRLHYDTALVTRVVDVQALRRSHKTTLLCEYAAALTVAAPTLSVVMWSIGRLAAFRTDAIIHKLIESAFSSSSRFSAHHSSRSRIHPVNHDVETLPANFVCAPRRGASVVLVDEHFFIPNGKLTQLLSDDVPTLLFSSPYLGEGASVEPSPLRCGDRVTVVVALQ